LISLDINKAADGSRAALTPLVEKRNGSPDLAVMSQMAWAAFSGTHQTVSGEPINSTVALQHGAVFSSVFAIASAIASMPLELFRRLPKGREKAVDNPLYRVFTVEPNSDMNASDMWFALVGHLALNGNAYAEILRNKEGTAVGLYPLDSRTTEPVRLPNKKLAYKTTVGSASGAFRIINAADILHLKFLSWNGLKGLSPIEQARNSVGLAIAAEKYGAKFFGNNSVPPALLTPVGDVSEEDLTNMREFWEKANAATNQGRIGVLSSDWKLTQLAITPEQSQFLETQQYSRTNIAALFNISPSRIGDMQKQSKASAENENISFVTDTLQPYMNVIEKELLRKILPADGSLFLKFDERTRLRGDFKTTMDGFAAARSSGGVTANELRDAIGLNPVGPEGDVLIYQTNTQNLARLLDTESTLDQPVGGPDPANQPPAQQRSLFPDYVPAFTGLFRDAVGRAAQRSKKDAETLSPVLTPVIDSISSLIVTEARKQFGLPDEWQPSDKIGREYLKAAASRAADWTAENRDESAAAELAKAIKTIHIGVFRDAGAAVAIRSTNDN
jgi:HK97 family phage portal protein